MMLSRNTLGLTFITRPPGSFVMGNDDSAATWDQSPAHRVTLSRETTFSALPITLEQYRRFRPGAVVNEQQAPFVSGVSWHDAVAFCEWLTEQDRTPYRLPTEAECEHSFPLPLREGVGGGIRSDRSHSTTLHQQKRAENPSPLPPPSRGGGENTLPLEWCLDWYGPYPHQDQVDPIGAAHGIARVVRGGVIDQASNHCDPTKYDRKRQRGGLPPAFGPIAGRAIDEHRLGLHSIGFRVVRGEMPSTPPLPVNKPLAFDGVRQSALPVHLGPPADRPHFRRRVIMPIPPDGASADDIAAAGFSRFFRNDHHSPGFEVMPNGDLLALFYSSFHEYDAEVGLVGVRLRFGCDEWDWPEYAIDLPGVNDHAPLLWKDTDGKTIWLAWGTPMCEGRFPFHFMRSRDNGQTWSDVQFPQIVGDIGPLEKTQPINTMLRDDNGTVYLPTDGVGGQSNLWASDDDGETWRDTGGRTFGRHTTFALLKDGRILGMGGKSTHIDGYMPRSISTDGGRTWDVSQTPFPALTSGQRPCVIRLASGRLFFCGDYRNKQNQTPLPSQPEGCYAALSDDDGETWVTRTLPGTIRGKKQIFTLGYSVARQGPNGLIHIVTSRTIPALHFELNEAWILAGETGETLPNDTIITNTAAATMTGVQSAEERYADGSPRLRWNAGLAGDGRYLLHGEETWFHSSGLVQRHVTYERGLKIGVEERYAVDGTPIERWDRPANAPAVWQTFGPDGRPRLVSHWVDRRRVAPAI